MSGKIQVHNEGLERLVEHQMRNWEFAQRQNVRPVRYRAAPILDFLTISRMPGLSATSLTDELHKRLGWPVFDREIIQTMAHDDSYRERIYSSMDERDLNWFEDVLRSLDSGEFARNDYYRRLISTISLLARKSHAIFVGRAVDLVLPQNLGLRIRLMASHEYCVQSFAKSEHLSHEDAEKELNELLKARSRFFRRHFKRSDDDPSRHDLIINIERLSSSAAADLIMAALQIRKIIAYE